MALLWVVATLVAACEPGPPPPMPVALDYARAWERNDHRAMWELLTPGSQEIVGEEGFIERLPLIAREMSLLSLEAVPGEATYPRLPDGSPDPRRALIPLAVTFRTERVGDFQRETTLELVLSGEGSEAGWLIEWSPEAILPELAPGRLVRMTRLPTTRGRIITRDGSELATFAEAAAIGVIPGQIRDEVAMLASLSPIVGLAPDEIKAMYTQSWVRPDTWVAIRTLRDLDDGTRSRLGVIEGIQLRPERVRAYPSGLLRQTLGSVGQATAEDVQALGARGFVAGDVVGKNGLELTLDEVLAGTFGWHLGIVEADERPVETLAETPAVAGLDAVLSIDPDMQRAAEAVFAGHPGAMVVQDPWSGEILVLASSPGDQEFNRATFGTYATGSSFKLVTAAAALRTGALRPGELIDCPVRWTGYGPSWVQINHESGALGMIDLRTALARSCNTFFYELGKRLNDQDPDLLPNTALSFGLGAATDIEFVYEDAGIVPSPQWKRERFAGDAANAVWHPGDATNLAIGQGYLLATPLQMANYVATVANDGVLLQPRLVVELRDRGGAVVTAFGHRELGRALSTPADLSRIRDGMRAVVADRDGTVYFPFLGYDVPVAGKSGTAETSVPGRVNAWFIGFAPFDGPTLAVATVFEQFAESEGRHGSQDAAAATREVLSIHLGGAPRR